MNENQDHKESNEYAEKRREDLDAKFKRLEKLGLTRRQSGL